MEFLEHRRAELSLAEGAGVDQHGHRELDAHAVRLRDLLAAALVDLGEELAAGEQKVEKDRDLFAQPAGVIAQIEHEGHCSLVHQGLNGVHGVLAAAGLEVLDLDIACPGLLETGDDGLGVGVGAVDLDGLAAHGGHGEDAAEPGADQRAHLVRSVILQAAPVDGAEDHPDRDARAGRRGARVDRNDLEAARGAVLDEGHADIGVVIGGGELIGAVLVGCHEVAPAVAIVAHRFAIHRVDIALVQEILDLDVAHGLLIILLAANGIEHIGAYPGIGTADGEDEQHDHSLEGDADIEKAGDKKPDALQKAPHESAHSVPP